MELFLERGYEQVTVAEIAQRAGLTARTFFRYFADKREVLFGGSRELEDHMLAALETSGPAATPLRAVGAALEAAASLIGGDHGYSRQRYTVIEANAELRERELIKMARLSAALADGLRRHGVPDPDASLAAETAIVVFRVAWEQWIRDGGDLAEAMRSAFDRLRAVASG